MHSLAGTRERAIAEIEGMTVSASSESGSSTLLTFLVADVRGYTRYSVEHGDHAAAHLSELFLSICREVVSAHGGEVFGSAGDQTLAAFDSAHAALHCAVALQAQLADEQGTYPDLPLQAGIGLDTGEGVKIGSDYRGNAINLAARICSLARGGEVFASETVIRVAHKAGGLMVVDRGEVILKGLPSPIRVAQIGLEGTLPSELPPLQPILVTHPNNLPDDPTQFIGRADEITAIASLVQQPHVRMVSLTGPGGTGKTRLALQVGNTVLHNFRDGVFFVDLSPLTDPSLVPSTVAKVLSVTEQVGKDRIQTLSDALREKHLLLVLDNFEHLLDARAVVASLLGACRDVTMLITSRFPLHLSWEQEYPVSPLNVPDPAQVTANLTDVSQYEAVALFIARAKAVKPGFQVTNENAPAVAQICVRLDGLPLAIELAAARIKLLPPLALLQRLNRSLSLLTGGAKDRPNRQQTLRNTIEWSYSLLTKDEQKLFAWLSVFAGGCSLEAAEALSGPDGKLAVLDLLSSLVDKSLVRQLGEEEPRCSMLVTIQDYAYEQLETSGEVEAIRRRHAEYYVGLAREAYQAYRGGGSTKALKHLELEQGNLRAALAWTKQTGEPALHLRLAGALYPLWFIGGHWAEGRSWAEGALALSHSGERTETRARVLNTAGELAAVLGDLETGEEYLTESVDIWRGLPLAPGETRDLAPALNSLAQVRLARGDRSEARRLIEEALAAARQARDLPYTALLLVQVAALVRDKGDYGSARDYLKEALREFERAGEHTWTVAALNGLGDVARLEGDYDDAQAFYEEAIETAKDAVGFMPRPGLLHNLAHVVHVQGDDARARRLFAEALALFREMGDLRGVAECVAGLACLTAETDPALTARLFSAATSLGESKNTQLSRSNWADYDRALAAVHARLDDDDFQAAWTQGTGMSLDEAAAAGLRDRR
ncbi:MAG TPA: tetratricopeptide repeat protein [Chloroflexota bacterium]